MTHSHPDHTIGAGGIGNRTGAELVAHPGDTRTFTPNDVRVSYLGLMSGMLPHLPFLRGIPVGRTVEDGDMISSQGGIRATHAPGHTPGSVCYLLEDRGVLFSGDTVFRPSAGRPCFPAPTLRTTATPWRSWEGWTSIPCAAGMECPLLVAPRTG